MSPDPLVVNDPRIVWLDDPRALDVATVGAKAAALARCTGVAFSADARSAERCVVVIDATAVLGDQLVSEARCSTSW